MILRAGHYKMRSGNVWLPVLIRVEMSKDDDGRVADRPRLVLYVGGERHERPTYERWGHQIWPCSEREHFRLSHLHTSQTVSPHFDLKTAPPLF